MRTRNTEPRITVLRSLLMPSHAGERLAALSQLLSVIVPQVTTTVASTLFATAVSACTRRCACVCFLSDLSAVLPPVAPWLFAVLVGLVPVFLLSFDPRLRPRSALLRIWSLDCDRLHLALVCRAVSGKALRSFAIIYSRRYFCHFVLCSHVYVSVVASVAAYFDC